MRGYLARTVMARPIASVAVDPSGVPLAYDIVDWTPPDGAHLTEAIYEEYGLQSIRIPGSQAHPTKLVQSAAMASVAPPRLQPESAPSISAPNRSLLEHGWWSVVAWTCGLALGAGALSDNSFLTHLATGRLIRSSGAPHHDLFTFASGGKQIGRAHV